MSALFNAQTKNLEATFAAAIDPQASTVAIAAWVLWTTSETHNSNNNAVVIADGSASGARVSLLANTTPVVQGQRNYSISTTVNAGANISDDIWVLSVVWTDVDDGTLQEFGLYYDDDAIVSNTSSPTAGTIADLTRIRIGQNYTNNNDFSRWKGRVAEVSVWTGKSKAQMAAIRDNLLLYYADANFPDHQPAAYWPLLDDATAVTGGVDLTNNGTTTFDAGTHPTLTSYSGGGGGGNPTAATCFMHRETPREQARRLGFSGWRGAV